MDELVNQISSRTGISEDQARQAVEMVIGFIKTKLPEPLASQVDSLVAGGNIDILSQLGGLSGLFGKQ